jgi:Domain of unknown function (DUF6249)
LIIFFGFFAFLRYLSYRETLALAEKGLVRPRRGNGKDALRWGIAITMIGIALCVGLWPLGMRGSLLGEFPLGMGPWMLFGLVPTFFGLGLILIYVLTREVKPKDKNDQLTSSELSKDEGNNQPGN